MDVVLPVGARVSLRVVERATDGRRAVDTVGDLLAADDERLVVRRDRDSVVVSLARSRVVAGRVVAVPARHRRPPHEAIRPEELERVAADGWRARETGWLGARPGGWLLRAAGGFTGRANSALAVVDPGMPVGDALAATSRWYAARALPAQVQVVDGSAVHRSTRDAGWTDGELNHVMTAPVDAEAAQPPDVSRDSEPSDAWLDLCRYRGAPYPPHARHLLLGSPAQVFLTIAAPGAHDEAVPAGAARVALAHGWAGITAMTVSEGHRRRGLAGALVEAAAGWAAEHGARCLYLQVAEGNAAARALYERHGFAVHHGYRYLRQPGSGPQITRSSGL